MSEQEDIQMIRMPDNDNKLEESIEWARRIVRSRTRGKGDIEHLKVLVEALEKEKTNEDTGTD